MITSPPQRLAAALLLSALAAPASAQSFSDAAAAGALRDRRLEASPLGVDVHVFQPRVLTKLFGVVTPHLFAAAGGGYTDNLLLGDHEAPGVTIERHPYGVAEAGLRLDTEVRDHRLEAGYRARYSEFSGSGGYDRLEHRADVRLDLVAADLDGHADLGWRRSAYPREIQLHGLVWLDSLSARVWSEARFGRFGVRVGGHAGRNDYLDRELRYFGHDAYGGDVQLHARLFARVRGLVEYNWGRIDFVERVLTGYQVHQLRGGLDGELSPKLTGSIKLGAILQRIDDDDRVDDREYQGLSAECALRWRPLESTTAEVTYSRSLAPSVRSNFLIQDGVQLTTSQGLLEDRVVVTARVGYEHAVVSPGEHLNRFVTGAQVRYRITEWAAVVVGYQFRKLESGFPDSDYREHGVYGSVGVGL